MNVTVLEDALVDLADGYRFYEQQSGGLGIYFLDSLWSDTGFSFSQGKNPGLMSMFTVQMGRQSFGWSLLLNWLAITACLPFKLLN